MKSFLLKNILPFGLALLVGMILWNYRDRIVPRKDVTTTNPTTTLPQTAPEARAPRVLPEIHILSTNMIDENIVYAKGGKKIDDVKILSPPDSQYTQAKTKKYRQGVMQLNMLFGADGVISEITPRTKRVDCGSCLPRGANVVELDPNAPASSEMTEAAKEAVRQIKFEPFKSAGVPVPVHGLVECVFRMD